MGFFSKKKRDDAEVFDDAEKDKPKVEKRAAHKHKTDSYINFQSFLADLERLKAQSEANNELRQLFSEKFSRIDEQIGEIHSVLVDREKEIQELEVTATKASDMVSEVHPEHLMIEVKKQEAHIEALKDKFESHAQINETIMEELKSVRNSIRTFRGIEELEKMSKDLLADQTVVKKIEAKIEAHADKVESMFLEINKKYDEFSHYKDQAENLDEGFNTILSEFEKFKVKFTTIPSENVFGEYKEYIHDIIKNINLEVARLKPLINKAVDNEHSISELKKNIKGIGVVFKKEFNQIEKLKNNLLDEKHKESNSIKTIHLEIKKDVMLLQKKIIGVKKENKKNLEKLKISLKNKKITTVIKEEKPSLAHPKLLEFIKKAKSGGHLDEVIHDALAQAGWSKKEIQNAFDHHKKK